MPQQQVPTILQNAMNGARSMRYGDIVFVVMDTTAYITTAQEFQIASQWARAKTSLGHKNKDRNAIIGKLDTLLARSGSGLATKGTNKVLQGVVKTMEQSGFDLKEWVLPPTLFEDIEVKKKVKTEEPRAEGESPAPSEEKQD